MYVKNPKSFDDVTYADVSEIDPPGAVYFADELKASSCPINCPINPCESGKAREASLTDCRDNGLLYC